MADNETEKLTIMEQTPPREVLDSLIASGKHEINRESSGLLLSGLSAGLDIGFGPLVMAVILTLSTGGFGDLLTELLLATGYSVGFMFVILGRSELFTEHTTLAMVPVLDNQATVKGLARLWGLVYLGNIIGGLLFTLVTMPLVSGIDVVSSDAFVKIAHKLVNHDLHWLFVGAVFAGWLMGLLAWLIAAAQETTSRLFIIWIVTATIGILHLPHSIAGNVEVLFGLFMPGGVSLVEYFSFLSLATLGNAFGGVIFVAVLKYGHVIRGAK